MLAAWVDCSRGDTEGLVGSRSGQKDLEHGFAFALGYKSPKAASAKVNAVRRGRQDETGTSMGNGQKIYWQGCCHVIQLIPAVTSSITSTPTFLDPNEPFIFRSLLPPRKCNRALLMYREFI